MLQIGPSISIILLICILLTDIQTASIKNDKMLLENNGITILSDSNFSTITSIDSKDPSKQLTTENEWLVLFYAGWCGHCKKFIQETYQFIKPSVDSLNFKVTAAALQCPSNPQMCKDFMIAAYPSVYYFAKNGKNYKYPVRGSRTKQDILEFVKASHNGQTFQSKKKQTQKEKQVPKTSKPNQAPLQFHAFDELGKESVLKPNKDNSQLLNNPDFKEFHKNQKKWLGPNFPLQKWLQLKNNHKKNAQKNLTFHQNQSQSPITLKTLLIIGLVILSCFGILKKLQQKSYIQNEVIMQADREQRMEVLENEQISNGSGRKKIFGDKKEYQKEEIERYQKEEIERIVQFEQVSEQKNECVLKQQQTGKSQFSELQDEQDEFQNIGK